MYLILQKWLNSSFPPLGSVPFFLSRSLFFFFYYNFLLSQSRFWLPGYFFLVRNEWVEAAADCTLHTVKGGTDKTRRHRPHGLSKLCGCNKLSRCDSTTRRHAHYPANLHNAAQGDEHYLSSSKSKNRAEGEAKEGRESRNKSLNCKRTVLARGSVFDAETERRSPGSLPHFFCWNTILWTLWNPPVGR